MFCRNCGTKNDPGNVFCKNCGFQLDKEEDFTKNINTDFVKSQVEEINTQDNQPEAPQMENAQPQQAAPQMENAQPQQEAPQMENAQQQAASQMGNVQPQQNMQQQAAPQMGWAQPQQPQVVFFNESMLPDEYKPISMWGYFGYQILFYIPCIGTILLLVFALGGAKNKNLRNYARSFFCFYILMAVIALIAVLMLGINF